MQPSISMYPIWLGVAKFDVVKAKDSKNFMKVKVQYCAPIIRKKIASDATVYKDYWAKS